jgi:hypothetical protein
MPFAAGLQGRGRRPDGQSPGADTEAVVEEILQRRNDRVLVRSGDVVRHPLHPWSAATRMLLRHLEAVGFPYSPRVVGHDGESDLLTFIPGASGADGWACVVDEEGLAACARLLRAYHQAVAGWRPDIDLEWFDGSVGTGGPGQLVCHGDFGPWNIVWDGTTPVGLLDFEYARPGDPLDDVAYACEYVVPFRDDATCLRWHRFSTPPNRRRRLELLVWSTASSRSNVSNGRSAGASPSAETGGRSSWSPEGTCRSCRTGSPGR